MTNLIKKKRIAINAFFILLIQVANAILPFILAPYLTKTIGADGYGVVVFGLAAVQIACIFTDYGFGLSAVYSISKYERNKIKLNKVITAVYICKLLLLIPVCLFFLLIPYVGGKFLIYNSFFFILVFSVIFTSLQPVWFFQGIEKMKNITICTLLARAVFVIIVFLLVRDKSDINIIAIANVLSLFIALIISLYLMVRQNYTPVRCNWKFVASIFSRSTEYFLSRLSVACYGIGSVFYLGIVSSPLQVAYYSVAEQFYRGAIAIYSPATQSLYPYMTKTRDVLFFKRILIFAVLLAVIGVVFGYFAGDYLIGFLFGDEYVYSVGIYNVFMVALLIAIPSILLGYPFLGALGDAKSANRSVVLAGIVQTLILILFYFLNFTAAIYVAYAVLAAELTALLFRMKMAKKYLIKVNN